MEKEHSPFSFEHWLTFVFDHPVPDDPSDPNAPHWYEENEDDSEWWDPSRQPEVTVAYLTTLFENAPRVLTPFSEAQIDQGFNFLVSNFLSAQMVVLFNPTVPWSERKHCLSSMSTLFEQFFAPRCSSHLSHLNEPGANPLNGICYMWWDMLHYYGNQQDADGTTQVGEACLEVMRMILDLDSDASRESALHGLSHWRYAYPQLVQAIQAIPVFVLNCKPTPVPPAKVWCSKRTAGRGHCRVSLVLDEASSPSPG